MHDKSLNYLIESIKNEGIAVAEKTSADIINKAQQEAERIIKAAQEKRSNLLSTAEKEAHAILEKGEAAFKQAGRDYSISIRNEILKLFQIVLDSEVKQDFTIDLVKTAILHVIKNVGSNVELNLSPTLSKELAEYIHDQLKSDQHIKIIENKNILKGFTISQKEEGWSFSISPEEVATALQSHLNHHWIEILNKGMS